MADTPSVLDRPNSLVVGGAGFIGSHLCEALLATHNVICVDNYSSGHENNIDHLLSHPHFEFIRHDISEPLDLKEHPGVDKFKISFVGVQQIYHLGCGASPRYYLSHPLEVMNALAKGTDHVMSLAAKHRAKVLLGSDVMVYGIMGEVPPKEGERGVFDHLNPLNHYAEGVRYAESLADAYRRQFSLEVKIVRIFGTYGPRMQSDDGRIIPELIGQALAGTDLALPSDIVHVAPCYVNDTVQGLMKVMELEGSTEVNLGHSVRYTLKEVAEKIIALTHASSKVVVSGSSEEGDDLMKAWKQQSLIADTMKVKEEAGWFPLILLDEGLRETIDYLKAQRGIRSIVN